MQDDTVPILVENGYMNQEMYTLLLDALQAGVSMFICASKLEDVNMFVDNFFLDISIDGRLENQPLLLCSFEDNTKIADRAQTLNRIVLKDFDIEDATTFHKVGGLLMYPLTTDKAYDWFRALLRGQVVAVMVSENAQLAVEQLSISLQAKYPQYTRRAIQQSIIDRAILGVDIFRDASEQLRVSFVDLGHIDDDTKQSVYIYQYDTITDTFIQQSTVYSFESRLNEVIEQEWKRS